MKPIYFVLMMMMAALPIFADVWADRPLRALTLQERHVIIDKGTERPFSGQYDMFFKEGIYTCKQCGAPLYRSEDKFDSGCGWPAFDDEITGAIKRISDSDGQRTEILCAQCGAHLGHVFEGEALTPKNIRHCVNSISLEFEPKAVQSPIKKAYFAGGCFWGVEYYLEQQPGVIEAVTGYMGGHTKNPTYKEVSYTNTGHVETVEVTYDASKVDFETLARLFFEIHDPTQQNGQGPDIGAQYRSVIFYSNEEEKKTVEKLIALLRAKGFDVATKLRAATPFYKAEAYHQDYYEHKGKQPCCHGYVKRF